MGFFFFFGGGGGGEQGRGGKSDGFGRGIVLVVIVIVVILTSEITRKEKQVEYQRPLPAEAVAHDAEGNRSYWPEHEHQRDSPRDFGFGFAELLCEVRDDHGDCEEVECVPRLRRFFFPSLVTCSPFMSEGFFFFFPFFGGFFTRSHHTSIMLRAPDPRGWHVVWLQLNAGVHMLIRADMT